MTVLNDPHDTNVSGALRAKMPRRRHLLVVGCGFPQLGIIRAAKRLGYEVTGADMNPNAVAVPAVDHFLQASTGDVDGICDAFKRSGAQAMATSGSELALTTTSLATDRLGLPFYADVDTVFRCQAKDAMRGCYRDAGLETPAFVSCRSEAEARRFIDTWGLPVVMKPSRGWGQRGVSLVCDPEQISAAFGRAAQASHGNDDVVVEQFIEGHEVSVNGWVDDGVFTAYCVTDREVFSGLAPLGVMRSEISPSRLPEQQVALAIETAAKSAKALGLKRGPCYCQVALHKERAVLFETAARLGGGFDADVTKLASGVDLYERLLAVAFDDPSGDVGGRAHALKPAMVRFLKSPPGVLTALEGLDQARAMPGVVQAEVYPPVQAELPGLLNAACRVGHLLVTGDTREQMLERADRAETTIHLVVQPSAHDTATRGKRGQS